MEKKERIIKSSRENMGKIFFVQYREWLSAVPWGLCPMRYYNTSIGASHTDAKGCLVRWYLTLRATDQASLFDELGVRAV